MAKVESPELTLEVKHNIPREEVLEKINSSYAVILASLGDISPNLILESLMLGKPFILTSETGLKDRLSDVGIFVDPLDANDIARKINWLSKPGNYQSQLEKIKNFSFIHTYDDIADEFLKLAMKI
jgi:glycosyltransferase involved in cell wall biosynthesis